MSLQKLPADRAGSCFKAAISELPERDRWIVNAAYTRGRSLQEIGGDLGISKQAVSKIIAKCEGLLRVKLLERGVRGIDGDGVLFAARVPQGRE